MKKRLIALLLSAIMVFCCTACGAPESAQDGGDQTGGNTVTVAMGNGFSTLDPGYCYEKYPTMVLNACYETLFKFMSNDGAPEPMLVDTYEFSEDGMTLTMTLKDGVTFASGNKMTSEDVAFSINRVKNLKSNPAFLADTIESVETPDEQTVILNLNQPDSAITAKLAYISFSILDSEVVKEHGGTDAEDAVTADTAQTYLDAASAGSGMYILTSYTPDEEIVMEKNPNYWGEGTNVDQYIVKIQPDANTQMMTLANGDLDVAMNMTDDTMEEISGKENIATIDGATNTVGFVMMNMNETYGGPVSDPLVQQAIRKAIDYAGMQELVGEGTATPYSLIQTTFMGSKGERGTDYTDVEAARELMKEAGYEDGFTIDMTVSDLDMEGVLLTDMAQKVAADLSEIGITVNIVTQSWAAGYGDSYRDGTLGFTVMYWGTDYNDPNVQLEFLPGGVVGLRAGWTADMDPDIAAYYNAAMNETNDEARAEILGEMQDATYEYGPFIMLAQAPAHIAYNTRLEGVAISDPYTLDVTLINVVE